MLMWLKENKIVLWGEWFYIILLLIMYFFVLVLIYVVVVFVGGFLILIVLLYVCVVIGWVIQFYVIVLGVNVYGYLKILFWIDYFLVFFMGGEVLYDYYYEYLCSVLYLFKKGFWNCVVDYNGIFLLVFCCLGFVKNLEIVF